MHRKCHKQSYGENGEKERMRKKNRKMRRRRRRTEKWEMEVLYRQQR
jgi:hypothetical protein